MLLIDSGGQAALALRADWGANEARSAASAPGSQDAQGRSHGGRVMSVRSLELNGQAVTPPPAQTWGKTRPPAGVDGYLGWGWLSQQRWVLDYRAQHLQLLGTEDPLPASCGALPQRFELLGSLPYLRLSTADGTPLALGLDSGASRNVVRTEQAALVSGPLHWGGQTLAAGDFASAPLQLPVIAGFLGQDFLSRHRVCVDPQQRLLWVQPL
ncbi:MAG: hypothetical protein DI603_08110 [Roseateles depolymerans]|uniref:Peptidase A2 domain-containing protein n=1 Tax=Roseateles depolymerans TaxID=76731 RepID=A0A2W5DVX5_9BURK|nr:MAG: hypothetical protein DI603_08110 [Roseateles depolymerans]